MLIGENKFYEICDKCEEIEMETKYYPSIEELENNINEKTLPKYLPFLIYFSNDPYGNNENFRDNEEYQESVNWINTYLKKNLNIFPDELLNAMGEEDEEEID